MDEANGPTHRKNVQVRNDHITMGLLVHLTTAQGSMQAVDSPTARHYGVHYSSPVGDLAFLDADAV